MMQEDFYCHYSGLLSPLAYEERIEEDSLDTIPYCSSQDLTPKQNPESEIVNQEIVNGDS